MAEGETRRNRQEERNPLKPIAESVVESVVSEISKRMEDPTFAQVAIAAFIDKNPDASRYISTKLSALGGEAVMHVVFHAQVLSECFEREKKAELPPISFAALDQTLSEQQDANNLARLADKQPALASYIQTNVEGESLQRMLFLLGATMNKLTG